MQACGADGAEPPLTGSERFLWPSARQIIDREAEAYEQKVRHLRRGRGPVTKESFSVTEEDKEQE